MMNSEWLIKMKDDDQHCKECCSKDLVEGEHIGITVCKCCGLEVSKLAIDYSIEGRALVAKNHDYASSDQNQIKNNMGTTETGFLTTLSTADASVYRCRRTFDLNTKSRFHSIENLCDKLNLSDHSIRNQACTISRELTANCMQKSIRLITIHAAAILYAARMKGGDSTRTFREVAMVAARPQKEIAKCVKLIESVLMKTRNFINNELQNIEHPIVSITKNFALYLNFPCNWVSFAEYLATKVLPSRADDCHLTCIEKPWEGRSRSSIAATVIYIASRLPRFPLKLDLKNVAFRTGVRISTIMICYRDIIPVIDKLLAWAPSDFVHPNEITDTFAKELLSNSHSIKRI